MGVEQGSKRVSRNVKGLVRFRTRIYIESLLPVGLRKLDARPVYIQEVAKQMTSLNGKTYRVTLT